MITADQFIIQLRLDRDKFKNNLGAYMAEAWEGQSIPSTQSTYKQRIFKQGLNTVENQIGEYGRYYSKKYGDFWIPVRISFGKQVDYVDLDFEGKLKNSIVVEATKQTAYLVTNSDAEYKKAKAQEELQGSKNFQPPMDIFTPSETELKKLEDRLILEIEKNIFFLT